MYGSVLVVKIFELLNLWTTGDWKVLYSLSCHQVYWIILMQFGLEQQRHRYVARYGDLKLA